MVTEIDAIPTLVGILVLVIPSMLLGRICKHFGISEIVGFVIGGIALGPFALGGMIPFFDRSLVELSDLMLSFWQISGIIILFSAGLHFTFSSLKHVGIQAVIIGTAGVIVPLGLGYGISILFGIDWMVAMIIGATLSATSITAAVTILGELGKEKTKEGNILVNAAVLDDVIGLAILSSIISLIIAHSIPVIETVLFEISKSLILWIILLLGAVFLLPKIVHAVAVTRPTSLESRGTKQATALGSAFGMAAIASIIGLNPIVGAFAAGMGLAGSKLARQVKEFVGELQIIFAPFFFAILGANVDILNILDIDLVLFVVILIIAVFSKILGSGIPAIILLKNKNKGLRIGCGMIVRGEIAFITAGIGLSYGIISDNIFSTLIFVILGTIFIGPILLRYSFKKNGEIQNSN
ncbi:cation:proton antiporter [Candidatus Nitrosopumilus sediminis]|uniref:Kef-type K transport system, membrane component n=1 Tax=Candidatus Nitrosopumilus sediminis TaxID=1229909 RepID=K0BHC1_9ARCH|nr:cation:proton antiporter [Candidatus Nitrosopumilus sediminis]AFS83686.1 Kef-type K transport system, membrane component [Candidatus Nitrosopumilus sediminis]